MQRREQVREQHKQMGISNPSPANRSKENDEDAI